MENQIYQFNDWTSAIRMKNSIDCRISIDVGVIRDPDTAEVLGYTLTVYNSANNTVLYKYHIDDGRSGTWSLTTSEAITMLNQIGFPCEFVDEHIDIPSEVREVLETLLNAGYSSISRTVRPARILVYPADGSRVLPMEKVIAKDFNYFDYRFLDSYPTPILSILDRS